MVTPAPTAAWRRHGLRLTRSREIGLPRLKQRHREIRDFLRFGTAQVHSTPLPERDAVVRAGDVAVTEGARRATGGAATSLAATRGYPWPVVKLACFGQRSWHELKTDIQNLMPPPRCPARRRRAKSCLLAPSIERTSTVPDNVRPTAGLVGGERARAKTSSWALAAEMERYLAAHNAPPNAKTVRRVRP